VPVTWRPLDPPDGAREPADGAPIVACVHGMEDSAECWLPLAARLGRSHRYYATNLPWRAGNDYRWRRDGSAGEWLAGALATLPGPPAVLIGHSFGANAILERLAADPPESPAAAVLIAPFYRPAALTVDEVLYRRAYEGFTGIMTEGLRLRLGRRRAACDEELLAAMAGKMLQRIGPAGFAALWDQFVRTTDLPLGKVAVPTLVLAGSADTSLAQPRADALAAAMPAADVRLRPEYGHFCHVEQADAVAAEVDTFLGRYLPALSGTSDGGER